MQEFTVTSIPLRTKDSIPWTNIILSFKDTKYLFLSPDGIIANSGCKTLFLFCNIYHTKHRSELFQLRSNDDPQELSTRIANQSEKWFEQLYWQYTMADMAIMMQENKIKANKRGGDVNTGEMYSLYRMTCLPLLLFLLRFQRQQEQQQQQRDTHTSKTTTMASKAPTIAAGLIKIRKWWKWWLNKYKNVVCLPI